MPRFTPDFLDELKTRLRPSDVIGRYVKLKKQGNEWAALSPFTKEKTPSFFVNDQKGFYHCFSSGKHGDVISFLQETQGLSFAEAVSQLAADAGMEIPADDPQAAQKAEERKGLVEACNAAALFFQQMLTRNEGRVAWDYVQGRGLTDDQLANFAIGYAPNDRQALKNYLINKGFTEAVLVEAGLLIKPEDGGASYDRFRHRVMFPIYSHKNDVIAFGGRALDPNARAKYLNSPETPIFHKGSVLYNFDKARRAATEAGAPLVVCEGYMDVIALWGAGFKTGVAPLGTALTENQIALLWRVSDEPVMCFDGDKAGVGAAHRSVDRVMPMLKPGKSLRFAFLPTGQDPDDLIREKGASGFQDVLDRLESLIDVVWRRELSSRPLDTPERRAALRAHLRSLVKGIQDKDVRNAYALELVNRLRDEFAPGQSHPSSASGAGQQRAGRDRRFGGRAKQGRWQNWREPRPTGDLRRGEAAGARLRDATLVLALVNHPSLIERQEQAFLELSLGDKALDGLLAELLGAILASPALDSAELKAHLRKTQVADTLERILTDETLNRQSFLQPDAELDEVEWGWKDAHKHHLIATNAARELADSAAQTFHEGEDIWKAAVTAREELINSRQDTGPQDDSDAVSKNEFLERLERLRNSVNARRSSSR